MLRLSGNGRDMSLMRHRLLLRRRTRTDATSAAVVADPVHRSVVDHRCVVNIVNVRNIYVAHRTVVVELPPLPMSSLVAPARVSVAITDSTVKTYLRTPVAFVKDVSVASPTPIRGSPQQAGFRRHHPRAWHPVIAVIVGVGPVPWGPEIAIARTEWLLIGGQLGRGK